LWQAAAAGSAREEAWYLRPEMSEAVAKFFEPEDPVPPHRRESFEDRAERRLRESFGGWCG
jgi:hypothetical protein